jgi:hypothetical protein
VVSAFTLKPAELPMLVTTGRRVYQLGEDVDVLYRRLDQALIGVARIEDDGTESSIAENRATGDGSLRIAGNLLDAGHYRISLQGPSGRASPSRDIWLLRPGAVPEVEVLGSSFRVGEAIGIRWHNAPGNRNDYVGIARIDATAGDANTLPWAYVAALPQGQLELDAATAEWGWPPGPGRYVVRLYKDDGYEQLAQSDSFAIE